VLVGPAAAYTRDTADGISNRRQFRASLVSQLNGQLAAGNAAASATPGVARLLQAAGGGSATLSSGDVLLGDTQVGNTRGEAVSPQSMMSSLNP